MTTSYKYVVLNYTDSNTSIHGCIMMLNTFVCRIT